MQPFLVVTDTMYCEICGMSETCAHLMLAERVSSVALRPLRPAPARLTVAGSPGEPRRADTAGDATEQREGQLEVSETGSSALHV